MKVFNVATIADIHFNAIPAERMYTQLESGFLHYVYKHKLDMVVIAGDLYDSIISYNSRAAHLSIEFIKRLIEVSVHSGVRYIRILKGTSSHDNNQLINLKVFESEHRLSFRIISTVEKEEIEGMKVLYIPEEYMKDVQAYYEPYLDETYDMIFGHGMFKETSFGASKQESAITLSGAPVFDSKRMCSICKGFINFGHIHTSCSIRDKITYTGSYSRWVFGEEEKKGFLVTGYDPETGNFANEFIENENAEYYDTLTKVDIDRYVTNPKVLCDEIDMANRGHLRVILVLEGDKNYSLVVNFLKEYYSKNKSVVLKITDRTQVQREVESEEKLNALMEKYGFIFSDNVSHAEKISKFIKIRDKRDVSVDKVKDILSLA